ncbi:hypothetical protein [Hymenobacter baengnokdamensis]|uniref:hypothetical protein n=1 Tax=Hymenobacter baengnokdamensis TaxID=2615203 RepID=UPI001246C8EE|nr:hypothetical protein [Hymenobacter baengnokdamensis]
MSKRQLTTRQQLRKELKEAEAGSVLQSELTTVLASMAIPIAKSIPTLLKLVKSATTQAAKHHAAKLLAATKDPRIIRPLLQAAAAPENEGYRSGYLWPLELHNFDCTAFLPQFVHLLLTRTGFDEVTWVCIEFIRKMKGPFEPAVARKCIRKLLAEINQPLASKELIATHANRLEAADRIMCTYFNQTARTYWVKWNKGESVTEEQ